MDDPCFFLQKRDSNFKVNWKCFLSCWFEFEILFSVLLTKWIPSTVMSKWKLLRGLVCYISSRYIQISSLTFFSLLADFFVKNTWKQVNMKYSNLCLACVSMVRGTTRINSHDVMQMPFAGYGQSHWNWCDWTIRCLMWYPHAWVNLRFIYVQPGLIRICGIWCCCGRIECTWKVYYNDVCCFDEIFNW